MISPEELELLVSFEIIQRTEEGHDITQIEKRFREKKGKKNLSELEDFLTELESSKLRPDFAYKEPSNLPATRAERPKGPRKIDLKLSDRELLNKIYGGWLGRCAGCLPVVWNFVLFFVFFSLVA
ncbi:MAG: hypothetical protein ACUVXA_18425, partial [Candidatus Jordarchaeum sp.]